MQTEYYDAPYMHDQGMYQRGMGRQFTWQQQNVVDQYYYPIRGGMNRGRRFQYNDQRYFYGPQRYPRGFNSNQNQQSNWRNDKYMQHMKMTFNSSTQQLVVTLHQTDIIKVTYLGHVFVDTGEYYTTDTLSAMNCLLQVLDSKIKSQHDDLTAGQWVMCTEGQENVPYHDAYIFHPKPGQNPQEMQQLFLNAFERLVGSKASQQISIEEGCGLSMGSQVSTTNDAAAEGDKAAQDGSKEGEVDGIANGDQSNGNSQ